MFLCFLLHMSMQSFKKFLFLYTGVLVLIGVFLIGWAVGRNEAHANPKSVEALPAHISGVGSEAPSSVSKDVDFDTFWEAWDLLQTEHVDRPLNESQMFYGAMHGMVASLQDPYSLFMEPTIAEDFQEELNGRFEGIGAEIGIRDGRLTIIAPLAESPAEQAGLEGGDKIYFIDGFDTTNITLNDAVNKIRGDRGTEVVLTIFRDSEDDFRDVTIKRDTIKIVSVTSEMKVTKQGKHIGYIKLMNFHSDSDTRFRKAVNDLLAQGPDGFIIDVRNNPGGFLDKAISISDFWVPGGLIIVSEKYSDDNIQSHLATGAAELGEFKTVVLINGGSASAAEILAGALQDHERATLIGEQSFGKGSIQDLHDFKDGSALKYTIAKWLTPLGHEIDRKGITPDVVVERTADDYNNQLDPQLDAALEHFDN